MRLKTREMILLMYDKAVNVNQLAAKTGISRNTISAIKNGKTCSDETAGKIAAALGVPVKRLIQQQ